MTALHDVITPLTTLEQLQAALLKVKELQQQITRQQMQIDQQAATIRQFQLSYWPGLVTKGV